MGCIEKHLEHGRIVERDCRTGALATAEPADGPGTELKAILRDWFGFNATLGCSCGAMAKRMNALGPDWCEGQGLQEILAAMRGEHAKRRAAGKTILPWSELAAKALVRIACGRARRKT
jgi:hypothetical protein